MPLGLSMRRTFSASLRQRGSSSFFRPCSRSIAGQAPTDQEFETNFDRKFGERGAVGPGRRKFKKGWAFMRPRSPLNLQERWHRAAIQRIVNYTAFENLTTETENEPDTLEFRMHFLTTSLQQSEDGEMDAETRDLSKVSPWHDIPLVFKRNDSKEFLCNYVNEIPKGKRGKMECATKESFQPIKQDVKKGKLRYFTYGDLPFNYGFLPQTWEDPNKKSAFTDSDTVGDNDPVDVVELSATPLEMGAVVPLKVLGTLGLIDEGETDWKVLAINADNPIASQLNGIDDVDRVCGEGTLQSVYDWFKYYKTTDGKPENEFSHGGKFQDVPFTMEVINECHNHWKDLLLKRVESDLNLDSVTYTFMVAQGITSSQLAPEFPRFGIGADGEHERFPDAQARAELTKGGRA